MNTRLILAAAAATASLAACGGGGKDPDPTSAGREPTNRKGLLNFAGCMREHGVDMPDPQFSGGRVTMRAGARGEEPKTVRAAEQACAKLREAVKPRELSEDEKQEFKRQALANARCMREHGIDLPDPQFSGDGGVRMELGRGIDPESPKFKRAQEACRDTLPQGPATTEAGER